MKIVKYSLLIIFIFIILGCSSNKYIITTDTQIDTMVICLNFSEEIPEEVKHTLQVRLNAFRYIYNSEHHLFKIDTCNNIDTNTLYIDLLFTNLVGWDRQIAGILINSALIAIPIVAVANRIPLLFYASVKQMAATAVKVHLSTDLDNSKKVIRDNFNNNGFLISEKRQIEYHGIGFEKFLREQLRKIEKKYLKMKELNNKE